MPTHSLIAPDGVTPNNVETVDFDSTRNDSFEAIHLSNDADLTTIVEALPRIHSIYIDFPAFTDGRGFSLARLLRTRHGFEGQLIADGQVIPDQFAFAMQCGFDGVRIDDAELDRHTAKAWADALSAFELAYQRGYNADAGQGPNVNIFDVRKTALVGS